MIDSLKGVYQSYLIRTLPKYEDTYLPQLRVTVTDSPVNNGGSVLAQKKDCEPFV